LYSYSFCPNPSWTREYPGQEEILSYLQGVAHKYELYRYIRFNTSVSEARWDEAKGKWGVEVEVQGGKEREFVGEQGGYRIEADYLVSAVGQLNVPRLPEIEGLEGFRGKIMHSARWDWTYGLEGKRTAIIGELVLFYAVAWHFATKGRARKAESIRTVHTGVLELTLRTGNGATAAQIIPEIVKEVSSLTIHQRTPNWIIPRLDAPIAPWKRSMYKWLPPIRQRKRADMMDFRESFFDAVTDNDSAFAKMLEDSHRQLALAQLPDKPELREKLEPNYKVGCKRGESARSPEVEDMLTRSLVIITDDYFPVFNRHNVKLETGKIDRITENGIVTDGKEDEYDLIVLATGFRTVEFMHPINIIGKGGKSLSDVWSEGGQALYGVSVEAMPNFGMLYGPNTNLGHNR
jgi:cation diffusion facilitator CzcD-associated flavoprotein CzcO